MQSSQARPVVVTGIGAVTAVGSTVDATWSALLAGVSGIRAIDRFETDDLPVRFAAQVDGSHLDTIPRRLARRLDAAACLALAATTEAARQAGLLSADDRSRLDASRIGVVLGNAGGAPELHDAAHTSLLSGGPRAVRRSHPYLAAADSGASATGEIARMLGATGPSLTISTECASGTSAIGLALQLIRAGVLDVAVCGGVEAAITPLSICSLSAVGALSERNDEPTRACQPFDRDRSGFVMGEGAGVLVLESLSHALARGAVPLVEVAGYGASTDVHHATAPSPDGRGPVAAVRAALHDAGIDGADIGVVNAHATGTPINDPLELAAIRTALGADADPAVHGIKASTGHTLGAAGAIEAIVLARTLERQLVPPTVGCENPIATDLRLVTNAPLRVTTHYGLSTSLGFGGQCAALVLRCVDPLDRSIRRHPEEAESA
ncbi:MAG: beta-ketoacyl-[acyl-carrier-protein] synthase family protein [Terracoccus sp.]